MKHSELLTARTQFLRVNHSDALCRLLDISSIQLHTLLLQPEYRIYDIPKHDGTLRRIEDPAPALKNVQRLIQYFLQCVYHPVRASAAFGFLVRTDREKYPRNIFTNAAAHIGCQWMFKTDLQGFFHQITYKDLMRLFGGELFGFDEELSRILAGLCTFHGRLPMGAPTSPVLSNLCCISLDEKIQSVVVDNAMLYTRFADDLCFSSKEEITSYTSGQILLHIESLGWVINRNKTVLLGPDKDKEVTGLVVGSSRIYLSSDFIKTLKAEVGRYAKVYEAAVIFGRAHSKWIQRYRERIEGMIRFAAEADERSDAPWRLEASRFDRALEFSDQEVLSWRDFPYI